MKPPVWISAIPEKAPAQGPLTGLTFAIKDNIDYAGVPTTAMVAPVIPAINDMDIERILDAVSIAGVKSAGYVLLRLPLEVRDLFVEWLEANYPDRAVHVMKLIRDMRGGKDNDPRFGTRFTGEGIWAELLQQRLEMERQRNQPVPAATAGDPSPPAAAATGGTAATARMRRSRLPRPSGEGASPSAADAAPVRVPGGSVAASEDVWGGSVAAPA